MRAFIEHLCRGAGRILLDFDARRLERTEKVDAGFVTEADLASERFLIGEIRREHPDNDILAEESGEDRQARRLRWILDPLDGTTNYAHGVPHFCVSIGVEEEGVLRWGAVYQPRTGELFFAERGAGAWLGDSRLRASDRADLGRAVFATGDYYMRGARFDDAMRVQEEVYRSCRVVRVSGSVALAMAYVASGRFDGFYQLGVNYWDAAAGLLLVQEAGGHASATDGGPFAEGTGSSVLACGPKLAPAAVALLRAVTRAL